MVKNQTSAAYLILVNNSQDHDFGYTCYMPENVIIDGLSVNTYAKTYVFQVKGISETTEALYPYVPTKKVSAKNLGSIAKQNFVLCINTSFLSDTVLEVE